MLQRPLLAIIVVLIDSSPCAQSAPARLQAYGSYVSGFYTPDGDLDVTIEGVLVPRCIPSGHCWHNL